MTIFIFDNDYTSILVDTNNGERGSQVNSNSLIRAIISALQQ